MARDFVHVPGRLAVTNEICLQYNQSMRYFVTIANSNAMILVTVAVKGYTKVYKLPMFCVCSKFSLGVGLSSSAKFFVPLRITHQLKVKLNCKQI